mgnify:CR=1 FL=1
MTRRRTKNNRLHVGAKNEGSIGCSVKKKIKFDLGMRLGDTPKCLKAKPSDTFKTVTD